MAQYIETGNYPVTIPTLSDNASIVEAFKYYHLGGLNGSVFPNSIEHHLSTLSAKTTTNNDTLGYAGIVPAPASVHTRLTTIEAQLGTSISSDYIKSSPSSNSTTTGKNLISPTTSSVIPLVIKGVNGQTANLQEWQSNSGLVAKVDSTGKVFSNDGTSVAEVLTTSGSQSITNKSIVTSYYSNSGTSYSLQVSDSGKTINFTNSAAKTVTVPLNSSQSIATGTSITITNLSSSGNITIQPVSGSVTVYSQDSFYTVYPYGTVKITKIDTDVWILDFMSKARNIVISPTEPTLANTGDIWLKY
jgi:hypothetical protein